LDEDVPKQGRVRNKARGSLTPPFLQPYRTAKDAKPSDEVLQNLFKPLDSSTTDTSKKRKNTAKDGSKIDTKKSKTDKLNQRGLDKMDGTLANTDDSDHDQPKPLISHDTHRWVFKSTMRTQKLLLWTKSKGWRFPYTYDLDCIVNVIRLRMFFLVGCKTSLTSKDKGKRVARRSGCVC
jgi:hypothetical protein